MVLWPWVHCNNRQWKPLSSRTRFCPSRATRRWWPEQRLETSTPRPALSALRPAKGCRTRSRPDLAGPDGSHGVAADEVAACRAGSLCRQGLGPSGFEGTFRFAAPDPGGRADQDNRLGLLGRFRHMELNVVGALGGFGDWSGGSHCGPEPAHPPGKPACCGAVRGSSSARGPHAPPAGSRTTPRTRGLTWDSGAPWHLPVRGLSVVLGF